MGNKKIAYNNAFNARKYDRIAVNVDKGMRDELKAHAELHDGGSVNAFINRAIREQMLRDKAEN